LEKKAFTIFWCVRGNGGKFIVNYNKGYLMNAAVP
jgi:hypothetical protein